MYLNAFIWNKKMSSIFIVIEQTLLQMENTDSCVFKNIHIFD